jgi:phosphonate transport system substrate-binding protein
MKNGQFTGIRKVLGALGFAAGAMVILALAAPTLAGANAQPYAFNVLSQRSVALTAQYWNPILTWVSKKSGVPLELKLAKTAKEGNELAESGAYAFIYTNHFFTPERDKLGFRVIARPAGDGIKAQIVVPKDSPIEKLSDLAGRDVAFVSPDGFTGYWLPLDALLRAGITVNVVMTGNQEASFAQLKVGKVAAAGVNSTVMARYGRRENFAYRSLWTSELYQDLCIMAHPRVPADKVEAVRKALVEMAVDPDGRKILEAGADLLKMTGELGFVAATNKDYDNYRAFYRSTRVK